MKKIKINFALKTKRGIRKENQDALMVAYNKANEFCAIVCDGVGSVKGSQYASNLVANIFTKEFSLTKPVGNVSRWFKQTLDKAMNELDIVSKKMNLPGISTTLAMVVISNRDLYTINIGDTRIYRIDAKNVKQLSFDHNYKNYLIRKETPAELIEKEEAKWNCLTNFIDASHPTAAAFEANSSVIDEKLNLLLCTDGLYNSLTTEEIHNLLWKKKYFSLNTRTAGVVNYCLKKDNTDNISCIVISVK